MKKSSKTVVFFGNECLATGVSTSTPTLRGLVKAGYRVAAVIINQEKARARNQKNPEIIAAANELQIPTIANLKSKELKAVLKKLKPDIGVLAAYGQIVPQDLIAVFPYGIVNIHPSLLPVHRGPTPIESVILGDDKISGVSIMRIVNKMDAGPIYAQRSVSVPRDITKQQLADSLSLLGSDTLVGLLPDVLNHKINPVEQNEAGASYDRLIEKKDGLINWQKPADRIEKEIRAYAGWPRSRTKLKGIEVIIAQAEIANQEGKTGEFVVSNNQLIVFCGQKSLKIVRLQPAGKKIITANEFIRGYQQKLGLG